MKKLLVIALFLFSSVAMAAHKHHHHGGVSLYIGPPAYSYGYYPYYYDTPTYKRCWRHHGRTYCRVYRDYDYYGWW